MLTFNIPEKHWIELYIGIKYKAGFVGTASANIPVIPSIVTTNIIGVDKLLASFTVLAYVETIAKILLNNNTVTNTTKSNNSKVSIP